MSGVHLATNPTAEASQRKRKAQQDNGQPNTRGNLSTQIKSEPGGSSLMPHAAPALPSVAGESQDAANQDTAMASLLPEEIQLWKAACIFTREPSVEELITILKVRDVHA